MVQVFTRGLETTNTFLNLARFELSVYETPLIIFFNQGDRANKHKAPTNEEPTRNGNKGNSNLCKIASNIPAKYCAEAMLANHIPIISETTRGGDNLVIIDKPTGDKQSSPKVWNKYTVTNHIGLTKPEEVFRLAKCMTKKPTPKNAKAKVNLRGIFGSLPILFKNTHIMANKGAIEKIKIALID